MELEKFTLGATGLRESDMKNGNVLTVSMKPNLKYNWDNGPAISRYLEELKNGRIIGKRCNKCARIMLPPRMFCELCWRPTDDWVYVEDTGIVNTFSLCYVNWDASRIPKGLPPHIPAVIEIDGATKGMGIMHMIGGIKPDKVEIGMKVRAEWKNPADRTGQITDIMCFKPY